MLSPAERRPFTVFRSLGILVALTFGLMIATERLWLSVVLVGIPYVLWKFTRPGASLRRSTLQVCAAAVVLAAIPIDVEFASTNRFDVRLVPILWGLPGPEAFERERAGEVVLRGCLLPLYPSLYVVRISW